MNAAQEQTRHNAAALATITEAQRQWALELLEQIRREKAQAAAQLKPSKQGA